MTNEVNTEKVSVNINAATLSQIDLLVDNGYYSNRSDFINHALRASLSQQQSTLDRLIAQSEEKSKNGSSWFLGISGLTCRDVGQMYAAEEQTEITGYGAFHIDPACDREKLFAVLKTLRVKGKVYAPADIKAHYGVK